MIFLLIFIFIMGYGYLIGRAVVGFVKARGEHRKMNSDEMAWVVLAFIVVVLPFLVVACSRSLD